MPAVIIIASIILGGFYYAISQISKQKSIEKQQQIEIKQKRLEQLTKEQKNNKQREAEQALDNCMGYAESGYSDRWSKECKAQGKLTSKCIDINELSFDEYLEKYGLTTEEYAKERNLPPKDPGDPDPFGLSVRIQARRDYEKRASKECSCRLLVSTADRFNEGLEKDKAECFKRYPQK